MVHDPYTGGENIDDAFVSDGLCLLVRDVQIDLTGPKEAHHVRVAHRVLTVEGASHVAHFSGTFDPALQEITVHYINVHRGEHTIEYARLEHFELLRREQNLERRVLDGRRTASLILPDIRPGDIVEQCWTTYTDNPMLRDFFCAWIAVEGPPARSLRYRVRAPADLKLVERPYGTDTVPDVYDTDLIRDRRWRVDNTRRAKFEPLSPPWLLRLRTVQIAEERSWEDISRHFAPHYAADPVPDALYKVAEQINVSHPDDPKERMMRALRFVQENMRYLSLTLGEGGLIPRPMERVLADGYGDCKDSSRLFAALAGLCGLDATPALVSTQYGPVIDTWLPTISAFDHCIARIRIGGAVYWIDSTRRTRAATADQYINALAGWALPLTTEGTTLELMPDIQPTLSLASRERLIFGKKVSQSARFELRLDYYGLYADWLGDQIANQGLSAVAERLDKRYLNDWPSSSVATPLQIEEDAAAYRLSLVGAYDIALPWKSLDKGIMQSHITDHEIVGELHALPVATARTNPIFLGRPRILKRRVEAVHPVRWGPANLLYNKSISGLRYRKQIRVEKPNIIVQEQKLIVDARTIDANEEPAYRDIVTALNRNIMNLSSESSGNSIVSERGDWRGVWWIVWMALILLSMIARIATIDTSGETPRQIEYPAPATPEPGSATETPPDPIPDLQSAPSNGLSPDTSAPSQFHLDKPH